MTDKYQNGKESDIYRNDSELTDSNSYMVYELNNTFKDKNKNSFKGSSNMKFNNKRTTKKEDDSNNK
jgi:hypothetical protein